MNRNAQQAASRQFRFEALESRQMFAAVAESEPIRLEQLGTYESGIYDQSAAEIVTYDSGSQRLFVTNGAADIDSQAGRRGGIDVLDIHDPSHPTLETTIDTTPFGDVPTSVDVHDGLLAIAVRRNAPATDKGQVALFDVRAPEPRLLGTVEVGSYPDNVVFTPDGTKILVANEGQPNEQYTVDPEGSVTIIDATMILDHGMAGANVKTATFDAFNARENELRQDGVRIYGPGASVAQDLEPEYITVGPDSAYAWVTLQENNAIAKVNIQSGEIESVEGLGYKDHSLEGNGLDASDRDHRINITTRPVKGMYQPDAISAFMVGDEVYLATANEGDKRDYAGFSEEVRVKDLEKSGMLSDSLLRAHGNIQDNDQLGRLRVTSEPPTGNETDGISELYAFGARSFSIWTSDIEQVYDSGDDFEQITADLMPGQFNSNHDDNDSFEKRSDDKGPEPEAVTVGRIGSRSFAFVGLERIGGIMVYEVTDPVSTSFVTYFTSRDVHGNPGSHTAGDLSPEGLKFISADESPIGEPLLVVANEVSGTTTILRIDARQSGPIETTSHDRSNVGQRTTDSFSAVSGVNERVVHPGDVNRDGNFNQLDVVQVLQKGNYLTGQNATFEEGDFNGDDKFDQLDVIAALAEGNYRTYNHAAHDATLVEYNHAPLADLVNETAHSVVS